MRVDSYRRPPLCRLCECPVVDGGVLVARQRLHRLSRWWTAHWDTACEKKSCTVCNFCAWDLRFADENSANKEPMEQRWWPKFQKGSSYKFYKDELLKPCSVKIEPLALTDLIFPLLLQTFECIYCKEAFPAKLQMSKHVRTAHKDVFLRCEYSHQCVTFFETLQERQKHYRKIHESGAKESVSCPQCSKQILKISFLQHLKLSHPHKEVIRCSYYQCSTYFKSQDEKSAHIEEIHESLIGCVYCDKFFPNSTLRQHHVRSWHQDVAIKCTFKQNCPNYFRSQEERQKHEREVHLEAEEKIRKAVQCLFCTRILAGTYMLRKHISSQHAKVAVKCPFPKCGSFFRTEADLKSHFEAEPRHTSCASGVKKDSSKNKHFRCDFCKAQVKGKYNLGTHIERVHLKLRKTCPHCAKPYSNKTNHIVSDFCKWCHLKFKCLTSLRAHTSKCKRVFHCPVCKKGFKSPSSLTYHCKIKHTASVSEWKGLEFESRGFRCDECFVFFRFKKTLEAHNKFRHAVPRYFECDFCGKGFVQKCVLTRHVQWMHLGSMAFRCSMCGVFLKTERNLRNHVKTHYNRNNYAKCNICDKSMKVSSIENHIKCIH